jgi:hypothetical protein
VPHLSKVCHLTLLTRGTGKVNVNPVGLANEGSILLTRTLKPKNKTRQNKTAFCYQRKEGGMALDGQSRILTATCTSQPAHFLKLFSPV